MGTTCSIVGDWRRVDEAGIVQFLRFRPDGTFGIGALVDLPGRYYGTYDVVGSRITLRENPDGSCPSDGTYTLDFDASCDSLMFNEPDDTCAERAGFLTRRPLTRYVDAPPPPPPSCIETTFEITNWPGSGASNSLYTGTSWELDDCTEIQPDPLTITIRCPVDSFGQARLISEGCGVLGVAAPGNILSDVGAAPSSGTACAGRTVENETLTCYQECRRLLQFRITSGPC